MQMAMTFIAMVGGLVLSLGVALLAEEFIFGQVLRLFAGRHAAGSMETKDGVKR